MKVAVALTIIGLMTLVALVDQTYGACCGATGISRQCGDGTNGTPCCGYGKCNFFCCKCQCRHGRKRAAGPEASDVGFEKMDKDGDGLVSLKEAHNHISSGACGNPLGKLASINNTFASFDRNTDGFLSQSEINSEDP